MADRLGYRLKLGIVIPSTNTIVQPETDAMRPPGVPDSFNARMDPIPAVGEHTTAILEEIGYSEVEIARLRSTLVI
jgi:crotonobetainyl-CoA:carnitine CoA-transferase CaiB-like acyl-CoA transferase